MKHTLPFLIVCILQIKSICAQTPLLKPGQAVFTFDAIYLPSNSSADWSFMVYDLAPTSLGIPGQNWEAAMYHPMTIDSNDWKKTRTGSLFGVTIDTIGNIYLAATSIYSGPSLGTAGYGGIYKVDAFDWSLSNFANSVSSSTYSSVINKIPNNGSGLGDVCYDKWHHQLFATNFEDGCIYRLSASGSILSRLDPFTLDPGDPYYASSGERIWAVNVFGTNKTNVKLFFSRVVENYIDYNEIWSIQLDPTTGDFIGVPSLEITHISCGSGFEPVSDICFDSGGNMFVAERSMSSLSTGAHQSGIKRYLLSGSIYTSPMQYFLGENSTTDGAGGIDLGFKHVIDTAYTAESILWSSADAVVFGELDPVTMEIQYCYGLTGLPVAGNSNIVGSPDYYFDVNYAVDHDYQVTVMPYCIPKSNMGDVEIFRQGIPRDSVPVIVEEPVEEPTLEDTCNQIVDYNFPNVITINGDEKNEKLIIQQFCEEGELFVYDRWGNLVYYQKDDLLSWDGKTNSQEQVNEGVYYCIVRSKEFDKHWALHVFR